MKNTPGDIIILHMCIKNYEHMVFGSWHIVCDRWMDRRMEKWHMAVGAQPKNYFQKNFSC